MDLPLDDEPMETVSEISQPLVFESLKEENIIPRTGNFLGLDISKDSSGICLYKDGFKVTANIVIDSYNKQDPFAEARARISLQKDLETFLIDINGVTCLDLIVIEDVFTGENPETSRLLYALNTAIDEMILFGKISCKEFIRASNKSWKSWLSCIDSNGSSKGLTDKLKIQVLLKQLGIEEAGEGFQDRLDATGMILGYLVKKSLNGGKNPQIKKPSVRVQFSDIQYAFEEDDDLVKLAATLDKECITSVPIEDGKLSKKKMIDYLSSDLDSVFVTRTPVRLGMLAGELGLQLIPQGGYFGFWLKPRAVEKYRKKLEVR